MLERKTTNIGCENAAETQFRVTVRNFRKVESRFFLLLFFFEKKLMRNFEGKTRFIMEDV